MKQHHFSSLRALAGRITGSDSTSSKVKTSLARLEKEAAGIAELISRPDPLKSLVAHELLVNTELARLRDLAAKTRGELNTAVTELRTAHDAARVAKAGLVTDEYAQEIRSVVRGLDITAKVQFMADAIKKGDSRVLAAVLNAPIILSGLTAEQVEFYREAALECGGPSGRNDLDELQMIVDTSFGVIDEIARPIGAGQIQLVAA